MAGARGWGAVLVVLLAAGCGGSRAGSRREGTGGAHDAGRDLPVGTGGAPDAGRDRPVRTGGGGSGGAPDAGGDRPGGTGGGGSGGAPDAGRDRPAGTGGSRPDAARDLAPEAGRDAAPDLARDAGRDVLQDAARDGTADGTGDLGSGGCGAHHFDCRPFACDVDAGRCKYFCVTSGDCVGGVLCHAGLCGGFPPAACSSSQECASGHCEQGVCCATACAGPCQSCALPGTTGVCTPVPGACAPGDGGRG